jgi:hypothetical protein
MCRCSEISGGFGQGDRVRSDEQTERLAGRSDLTARSARCGKRNGRRVARRAVPRRMTGYCAEEKAGVDVGPSRSRFWTPQLGGERAYRGRLGKDRSLRESRLSSASANRALPPVSDIPPTAMWRVGFQRALHGKARLRATAIAARRAATHSDQGPALRLA